MQDALQSRDAPRGIFLPGGVRGAISHQGLTVRGSYLCGEMRSGEDTPDRRFGCGHAGPVGSLMLYASAPSAERRSTKRTGTGGTAGHAALAFSKATTGWCPHEGKETRGWRCKVGEAGVEAPLLRREHSTTWPPQCATIWSTVTVNGFQFRDLAPHTRRQRAPEPAEVRANTPVFRR